MKTSELTRVALDWAVAKAGDMPIKINPGHGFFVKHPDGWEYFTPSADWGQGGSIIAKEKISIISQEPPFELWRATNGTRVCEEAYSFEINNEVTEEGPTPLIAAMRCFVASKLGDEVDIPQELQC